MFCVWLWEKGRQGLDRWIFIEKWRIPAHQLILIRHWLDFSATPTRRRLKMRCNPFPPLPSIIFFDAVEIHMTRGLPTITRACLKFEHGTKMHSLLKVLPICDLLDPSCVPKRRSLKRTSSGDRVSANVQKSSFRLPIGHSNVWHLTCPTICKDLSTSPYAVVVISLWSRCLFSESDSDVINVPGMKGITEILPKLALRLYMSDSRILHFHHRGL